VPGNEGRQRLGNRQDYVRMEIEPAQERRDVQVIPILVGAARLLSLGEMPGRLAKPRGVGAHSSTRRRNFGRR